MFYQQKILYLRAKPNFSQLPLLYCVSVAFWWYKYFCREKDNPLYLFFLTSLYTYLIVSLKLLNVSITFKFFIIISFLYARQTKIFHTCLIIIISLQNVTQIFSTSLHIMSIRVVILFYCGFCERISYTKDNIKPFLVCYEVGGGVRSSWNNVRVEWTKTIPTQYAHDVVLTSTQRP